MRLARRFILTDQCLGCLGWLQLRPMFSDVTYLEDQHLLVAVKGASDEHEVFGRLHCCELFLSFSE